HRRGGRKRDCTFANKGAREQNHLYLRTEPVVCAAWIFFHGPSCALPDIFLKDSPKDTPDENKRRERLQTWRLDAMCSIKNPFRIGNVYLGNAKQIVGIFKIPH